VKFRPVILFPLAAVVVTLLYAFGETRLKPAAQEKPGAQAGANAPHQGGDDAHAHDHSAGVDYILSRASLRLTQEQSDSVNLLTNAAEAATTPETKYNAYKQLGNYWMRTGNFITAGYYHSRAADASPNDKVQRRLAARTLAVAINGAADSTAREFAVHHALHQYEALRATDPNDVQAKLEMALVYVEGTNETMQGVLLLREVEKTDPENETMNLTLGRLAVVSGQFDKAITRLEKLVQRNPNNAEAYIHLAEAYRATGQKTKALQALEQCKRVVKDSPEAVKQVEQIIASINKS